MNVTPLTHIFILLRAVGMVVLETTDGRGNRLPTPTKVRPARILTVSHTNTNNLRSFPPFLLLLLLESTFCFSRTGCQGGFSASDVTVPGPETRLSLTCSRSPQPWYWLAAC